LRLALAGGGTGGHVVPGLALLEHLRDRGAPPEDVLWFSAGRSVEERALARLPERAGAIPLERVVLALEPPESGAPSWARLLARTAPETKRARTALQRHASDVLLALGGFTALPAVLAARILGIPVVLLEINSVAGRATRSLSGLAERVVHAWPGNAGSARRRHRCLGPPLGAAFARATLSAGERARARAALGFRPDVPLLLVLGGSQGAAALNRFVARHGPALVDQGLEVLHQAGPGRAGEGPRAVRGIVVVEYLDDVAGALDAATLVLSRGGAATLAEIAARARPALVVPYPHHSDRHQERNALALGAGVRLVPEERLDADLVATIARLAGPGGTREREAMERALATAVPRDGAARLADELLLVAGRFRTTTRAGAR
jgi:UDP-N-acetylglucosamine--N-acetylmuramyl-(pentapeptide) pyrophosphoryl-undecaprenol N-acetylglucosamine transferase